MRFHCPSLPGRPVTRENSHCAYSQKVRKFALMMEARGHECFVYGYGGPELPFKAHRWAEANADMASRINENREDGDFLCIVGGLCQQSLADAVPLMAVEPFIGYGGTFAPFRVFESKAWQHTVYGAQAGDPHQANGFFFDAVIPNYFEPHDFPLRSDDDGYLLYLGRMVERKGVFVAAEIAERMDVPLILAGAGEEIPDYGEYVGAVGPDERAELLGGARALLAPTLYIEPFGGVVVEAHLCGTPTITTDFGAFTETVIPGFNGYRAHTLGEFMLAVEAAQDCEPVAIRSHAEATYSLDAIAPKYERYFERLNTLKGEGFYETASAGVMV